MKTLALSDLELLCVSVAFYKLESEVINLFFFFYKVLKCLAWSSVHLISQLIKFLYQSSKLVNSPEVYINEASPGPFLLIIALHLPLQKDIPAFLGIVTTVETNK